MKPRIMYLEAKDGALAGGEARIGRVTFSKTGQTIYYGGRAFHKIPGGGFKSNYYDEASRTEYWISGPKKNGRDRLYSERVPVEIDEDVRVEYWTLVRNAPEEKERKTA
ncbi:MAG: 1-deoxy-D-xylulose-5-phosphate synthase [Verrucomicrobiota bacterium]